MLTSSQLNTVWVGQINRQGMTRIVQAGRVPGMNVGDMKTGTWPEWVSVAFGKDMTAARKEMDSIKREVWKPHFAEKPETSTPKESDT